MLDKDFFTTTLQTTQVKIGAETRKSEKQPQNLTKALGHKYWGWKWETLVSIKKTTANAGQDVWGSEPSHPVGGDGN